MSDIQGDGYGSKHDWKRGDTGGSKVTPYKCVECGQVFNHFYDETPNIFEAMKESGVTEECTKDWVIVKITYILKDLNDEQRMKIFTQFCTHCGKMDPHCRCWRDE